MEIPKFLRRNKTIEQKETVRSSADIMRGITWNQTSWLWGLTFQENLTAEDKKRAYYGNEIIFKGVNKRSRDLIYNWFEIDSPIDGETIPENITNQLNDFITRNQVKRKLTQAVKDALIYGNGWIEYICAGSKEPQQPLNGKLIDIRCIDPTQIIGYQLNKNKTEVEYWKYKNGIQTIMIHSSRIGHIGFYYDGDNPFSISPLEVACKSIKADNDATTSLDDNLIMFGHPFPTINTSDNVNQKKVDDAFKVLEQIKKRELKVGFAGFKDTLFQLLNPASPSPHDALYHFYIHLSAAMDMPMMFLIGEKAGQLTGNEIELGDYYKSIEAQQKLFISPLINQMFNLLIGESIWRYEVYWNPLFVDEKTEIANKTLLMNTIGQLYSLYGLVDVMEARQMLREYDINIPEDGMLDEPEPIEPEPEPEPTPDEIEPNEVTTRKPTRQEMAIARKQRALGERLIKEGAAK